ncbi:Arm repeat superfamily protein [Thalictrum thalictroides]|uniref:Arm repeat superfamily protein n=1 Tax=Thalictrum thalictroides TaxID=46969 RepID=A0A7J6V5Y8_THATH|nr:Arm repeat superfamily protein [Thalictrum thalictroides]
MNNIRKETFSDISLSRRIFEAHYSEGCIEVINFCLSAEIWRLFLVFFRQFSLAYPFALQCKGDVPGLETTLAACLERIFNTKYGASLIPQFMPFVQVGLQAESQIVRCLACKTVMYFLENGSNDSVSAALVIEHGIYPLLLDCLVNGDELVAKASTDAIKSLAKYPESMEVIFPANSDEATHLSNLAARCSSLGRIRVLALIVKLFSVSTSVASTIYSSNMLSLFESEILNANDLLATLSVLELLYELSETPHGADFLARGTFLQLLTATISNTSVDSILRSRAIMIIGRLFSTESTFAVLEESSVKTVLTVLGERMESLKDQDTDEFETAAEALGQIGSSIYGAALLFSTSLARYLFIAAFERQGRGKQLAALHALGNIVGEIRSDDKKLLNVNAEESLRSLIYEIAARSSKLTPSALFLSILRQDPEIRLATYRIITGLVARPWCLMEICSKQEIIGIVTDPHNDSTKNGMEARYNCCEAIYKALSSSNKVSDPSLADIAEKLHEAVKRGPYLARARMEAQPSVMTAER